MIGVKIDFSRLSNANLNARSKTVDTGMTNNPYFVSLADDVSNIHSASVDFSTALGNVDTGTPEAKAIVKVRRKILVKALRTGGIKANLVADGDEAMLATTGYFMAKTRGPVGPLDKGGDVRVIPAAGHGNMKMKVGRIKGATSYLYQVTKAPVTKESVWTSFSFSKSSYVFTGLESGQQYAFRVAGVGSHPDRIFSDEISSYVL